VTFVLPAYIDRPNGGFKVVYQYASRLQARGHRVTVLHPYAWSFAGLRLGAARAWRWQAARRVSPRPLAPWFLHHPGVRLRLVHDLSEQFVPDADAVFATGWETARAVADYQPRKGAKYYLIQHYETWAGPKEEVDATWRYPLRKIVIARWLQGLAREFGEAERTTYIPNGVELDRFRLLTPISARNPFRVGMLYHGQPWKGAADGIAALARVRQQHPNLEAIFFGTQPRSPAIPDWVTYVENPSQPDLERLYNSCAIFLHTSWTEGWGLTAAEAVACGCALVAAGNDGVREFASDETAILVPIKDPELLADGVLRLLGDDTLRRTLASASHDRVQVMTWDRAVDSLESLLTRQTFHPFAGRAAGEVEHAAL
jgi:glycosyltransferase involved in cell wall biosynthesis